MNIAYFANYAPGSNTDLVYRTLLRLNKKVHFFSSNVPKEGAGEIRFCEALVDVPRILEDFVIQPDLVLFVEYGLPPLLFPQRVEEVKAPTCWWGIDTHMNYLWHKEFVHFFDHSFFAQKDFVARAAAYSKSTVHWLPLACSPAVHTDLGLEKIYPCTFVGNMSQRRERYFAELCAKTQLKTFSGKTQAEMAAIYSQSKAVFNLPIREDVNMRVFEAMGCGAALITQKGGNGLLDLFRPGFHFLPHSVGDAAEVINEVLRSPERLAEIAQNGYKEVHSLHTYEHRIETILQVAGSEEANKSSDFDRSFSKGVAFSHRHFAMPALARSAFADAKKISTVRTLMANLRRLWEYVWYAIDVERKQHY